MIKNSLKSNDINVKASKSINQAAEQTKRIHLHNVTYVTYVTDLSSADIEYLIPEMLKMPTLFKGDKSNR